jgi:hypothetical protein
MSAPADILRRLARLEAETPDDQTVAELLQSDEWIEIEAIALRALEHHGAARLAIAAAITPEARRA